LDSGLSPSGLLPESIVTINKEQQMGAINRDNLERCRAIAAATGCKTAEAADALIEVGYAVYSELKSRDGIRATANRAEERA
jgi:hypothetical protein